MKRKDFGIFRGLFLITLGGVWLSTHARILENKYIPFIQFCSLTNLIFSFFKCALQAPMMTQLSFVPYESLLLHFDGVGEGTSNENARSNIFLNYTHKCQIQGICRV